MAIGRPAAGGSGHAAKRNRTTSRGPDYDLSQPGHL